MLLQMHTTTERRIRDLKLGFILSTCKTPWTHHPERASSPVVIRAPSIAPMHVAILSDGSMCFKPDVDHGLICVGFIRPALAAAAPQCWKQRDDDGGEGRPDAAPGGP